MMKTDFKARRTDTVFRSLLSGTAAVLILAVNPLLMLVSPRELYSEWVLVTFSLLFLPGIPLEAAAWTAVTLRRYRALPADSDLRASVKDSLQRAACAAGTSLLLCGAAGIIPFIFSPMVLGSGTYCGRLVGLLAITWPLWLSTFLFFSRLALFLTAPRGTTVRRGRRRGLICTACVFVCALLLYGACVVLFMKGGIRLM